MKPIKTSKVKAVADIQTRIKNIYGIEASETAVRYAGRFFGCGLSDDLHVKMFKYRSDHGSWPATEQDKRKREGKRVVISNTQTVNAAPEFTMNDWRRLLLACPISHGGCMPFGDFLMCGGISNTQWRNAEKTPDDYVIGDWHFRYINRHDLLVRKDFNEWAIKHWREVPLASQKRESVIARICVDPGDGNPPEMPMCKHCFYYREFDIYKKVHKDEDAMSQWTTEKVGVRKACLHDGITSFTKCPRENHVCVKFLNKYTFEAPLLMIENGTIGTEKKEA